MIYPKNQKTLSFFSFFKVMTKKKQKNSRKTKKKTKHEASDQTFSEKFWFFGFLVFSRFRKNHSVEREKFY